MTSRKRYFTFLILHYIRHETFSFPFRNPKYEELKVVLMFYYFIRTLLREVGPSQSSHHSDVRQ
jgi:hypothetical protein